MKFYICICLASLSLKRTPTWWKIPVAGIARIVTGLEAAPTFSDEAISTPGCPKATNTTWDKTTKRQNGASWLSKLCQQARSQIRSGRNWKAFNQLQWCFRQHLKGDQKAVICYQCSKFQILKGVSLWCVFVFVLFFDIWVINTVSHFSMLGFWVSSD